MPAEDIIIGGQFALVIGFSFLLAKFSVLFQQDCRLSGEVNITITRGSFRFLDDDILAGDFLHIPTDMNGLFFEIHIAPLQSTTLAPAHTRGDNQFEISFIFDAFLFKGGNELLRSFFIGYILLFLLFASFLPVYL